MKFVHAKNPDEGIEVLAARIIQSLKKGQKTLWLIAGGSNIPVAVKVLSTIHQEVPNDLLANLTVTLTDERYGQVGHADSNWQQLIIAGFEFKGLKVIPVLRNSLLEETVKEWGRDVGVAFNSHGVIIGQFGLGSDGHIAGILPYSPAVMSLNSTAGYEAKLFTRLTLTPKIVKRIQVAFVFAFGQSKHEMLETLKDEKLPVSDQPAQLLKNLPEVYVYSDQV